MADLAAIQRKYSPIYAIAKKAGQQLKIFQSKCDSNLDFQIKLKNLYKEIEYYENLAGVSKEELKNYENSSALKDAIRQLSVAGQGYVAVLTNAISYSDVV